MANKITALAMQRGAIRVYPPCHNRRGKGYTFAVNKGFMHGEGYSEALGS
jgi:hypothetical protein